MRNSNEKTGALLSPLCACPASNDDGEDAEVTASCASRACASPKRVVVKTADDEEEEKDVEGGPQTLSVSFVPGVSSTSPRALQSVWVRHFTALDSTSEKVPLVHGLQSTSSVSLPRFFTLIPGGQSEWGLHSMPPSPDKKLLGGHVQTRPWVAVQGTFSTKPAGHGARQRWHCWTPFSPRVKVPSGQGLHSLTTVREQWTDTWVPAGHLSQNSWVPESGSVC